MAYYYQDPAIRVVIIFIQISPSSAQARQMQIDSHRRLLFVLRRNSSDLIVRPLRSPGGSHTDAQPPAKRIQKSGSGFHIWWSGY
ncbi:unnamed protein product [Linum trigynum]|uniref:Uncharacterized protein n=1 Tax=Linum trigynum TaxID=586398 RepID=A0AAV2DFH6_9ROSI